jgi:hypothetical protein
MAYINVRVVPNCTWSLNGDSFFCTHDEVEVVGYVQDFMGIDGHYQTESEGYACVECGEPVDGSPELDHAESVAEMELMERLGK